VDATQTTTRRVSFALEFPDAIWPVEVDPGELELVVLNLAVNARDAMPDGGTIVVRAENLPNIKGDHLAGDDVRLSVIDTGMGVPAEVREHVFEPYFTTKGIGKGSELGLAQVYGVAIQSRGAVRINSEVGRVPAHKNWAGIKPAQTGDPLASAPRPSKGSAIVVGEGALAALI
jgi:signal transduction histidine kinase